jgi:FtsP/CotA-like multicopper oxidase with cupredoxin domain
VTIWGFVPKGTQADCGDVAGTATLPNPVLHVDEGDVVTLNVTNRLPDRLTLDIPGIDFAAGSDSADPGATVSRTFTASTSGTYLYQSSGDGERQTAMGLYGALTVGSTVAGQARDVDVPLVLSALDPDFNDSLDPGGYDMTAYHAQYWLINGRAYPDTQPIAAAAGKKVLLRYLNAGFDNTTMTLLGMDEQVLARDAHVLNNPFAAHAETIPAGATEDALATVPATSTGYTNGFPLYNRQLHLGNGEPGTAAGGMMTFIQAPAP